MTTKRLLVEVQVENHADFKKNMDEVLKSLSEISTKQEQLTRLTNQNAAAAVKAYEHLSQGAKDRAQQLSGELSATEKLSVMAKRRLEETKKQEREQKKLLVQERKRERQMTLLLNSTKQLVGSSTQMLRSFALLTAANEEDAQAMIKRIAEFEGLIQAVQGAAGAFTAARQAYIAFNKVAAGGGIMNFVRNPTFGNILGGVGTMAAGAAAVGGGVAAYQGLRSGGGQGFMGTLTAGFGGVSQNQGGVSSVGDMTTGPFGEWNPYAWGGSPLGQQIERDKRQQAMENTWSRQQSEKEQAFATQNLYFQQREAGHSRIMRLASPEQRYGLREQQRARRTEEIDAQMAQLDPGTEKGRAGQRELQLQKLDLIIQAEEDKHNKELDNKRKQIEGVMKEREEIDKKLASLSKIHQMEMSGAERFLSLDPMERAQAKKSLERIDAGTATYEDVKRTAGMRNEEQEKEAKRITAEEAGAAGYFDAIGTSLEDVLGRMQEIGNLEIQLKTNQETVVRLEGEWNELATQVGAKVQAAVQSQFDKLMAQLDAEMMQNNAKVGQYTVKAPMPQQAENYRKSAAQHQAAVAQIPDVPMQRAAWTPEQRSPEAAKARSAGFGDDGILPARGQGTNMAVPESATGAMAQEHVFNSGISGQGSIQGVTEGIDERFKDK